MKERIASRKVDELGRIVLPIDFRNKLGINEKDSVNVYIKGAYIVIEKQE